ncbi:MAG: tetratricopeptide repeat protein [Planctomycetota bacterium]|nr:tetratricopeptide repeat protein [Planctomycetota bacterium]
MNAPTPSRRTSQGQLALVFLAGMLLMLVLGGLLVGVVFLVKHRGAEESAAPAAPETPAPPPAWESQATANRPGEAPAETPGATPNANEGVQPLAALPPPREQPPEPSAPAGPAKPSVLGTAGTVDTLDVPVQLPKGMLPFLKGIDALGANRPLDAIPSFSEAIAADEENSDFHTARGASYVVAERMQEGLPDLQRALKLNPKNILAGRMTRLAYLMLGEQLAASKFYGHGSSQGPDFLITEVGVGYGSRALAQKGGFKQDPRDQMRTAAAIQKLPAVASMVASSYRAGEQKAVQALFALGVEQVLGGDFAAARRNFADVLVKYPYDWTSRYYYARSLLETGDPELARRELTYALCWKRFLPEAFAARALAAARQGDARRAKADLEAAARLDPRKAAAAQPAVDEALRRSAGAAGGGGAALWDALLASAKGGATQEELIAAALKLRQSANAGRLRWDETYQDRLHELCAAARAKPGDADRLADAGWFLYEHREVRALQVEPNGAPRGLRRQTADTAKWETDLAFTLAGEALAANPKHARSWALKSALLLHAYANCEEAEQAGLTALRFDAGQIDAHMALSDCYHEYATRLREKAAALRTPKTGTRNVRIVDQHGSFIRNDTESYLIPPSAADLAAAAECDRLAEENDRKEQTCLANALKYAKGTPQEPYYQALLFYLRKDYAQARPWLEQAVRDNPKDPKMRHGLANCLRALGLQDEYVEEFARAIALQETSAEVWLNVAWTKLERNAWESARKVLLRAREADPADARIGAYWGIQGERGAQDAAEATGGFRAALAQEEARARMNGTTFQPGADALPLSPEDLGLTVLLRLKLARYLFREQPAQAAEWYLATAGLEPRMSDWNLAKAVFSAILPNPDRDEKQTPGPLPLVTILKNNRIFAGQALLNAGRSAEAAAQFAEAENYANRLPAGGTAYLELELEPQFVPFRVSSMPMYAKALNAQALLQQGRKDEARIELQQVRYYLANRSQEQYQMKDDPIPALYARLAPSVGLR